MTTITKNPLDVECPVCYADPGMACVVSSGPRRGSPAERTHQYRNGAYLGVIEAEAAQVYDEFLASKGLVHDRGMIRRRSDVEFS